MSGTGKDRRGVGDGWRSWCRRNMPDTVAHRRDTIAARVDQQQTDQELELITREADLPEPCDGVGCELCSDESWREEPLPAGVTVQPAEELEVLTACEVKLGGVRVFYPAHYLHIDDLDDVWDDHSDCEQCTGYPDRDDLEDAYVNPVRGVWYTAPLDPELESPCYGCRRGLRRGTVTADGESDIVHLVREGVTIDCTGTAYLVDRLLEEI